MLFDAANSNTLPIVAVEKRRVENATPKFNFFNENKSALAVHRLGKHIHIDSMCVACYWLEGVNPLLVHPV